MARRSNSVIVKIDKQQLRHILKQDTARVLRDECERMAQVARQIDPKGVYSVEVHEGVNRAYAYVTSDNAYREANTHALSMAHKAVTS